MKRILKPVGHCLTTIAITSAMLEVYPAVAAEAANPETSAPARSASVPPRRPAPITSEVVNAPTVAPPERMDTVEKSSKAETTRAAQPTRPNPEESVSNTAQSGSNPSPQTASTTPSAPVSSTPVHAPSNDTPATASPPTSAAPTAIDPPPAQTAPEVTEQSSSQPEQAASSSESSVERENASGPAGSPGNGTPTEQPETLSTEAPANTPTTEITTPAEASAEVAPVTDAEERTAENPASEAPLLEFTNQTVAVPSLNQLQVSEQTKDPLTPQEVDLPVEAIAPTNSTVPARAGQAATRRFSGASVSLEVPCIPLANSFTDPSQQVSSERPVLLRGATVPLPPPQVVQLTGNPSSETFASGQTGETHLPPLTPLVPLSASPNSFVGQVPEPIANVSAALSSSALTEPGFAAGDASRVPQPFVGVEDGVEHHIASVTPPDKFQKSLPAGQTSTELTGKKLVKSNLTALLNQFGFSDFPGVPPLLQSFWPEGEAELADLEKSNPSFNLPAKTAISIVKRSIQPDWEMAEVGQQLPSLRLSASLSDATGAETELPKVVVPAIATRTAFAAVNAAATTTDCLPGAWASALSSIAPDQLFDWGGMVFPLPIRVPVTSGFGWRIHPITGHRRIHAGVDFGAPQGTPVLAAMSGRVVAAESMGGYGLTVVIENEQMQRRNLYAHLSAIAVQPGTWIEAGSILGLVGSTGFSTGPHLHFEFQTLTESGWVAVDPLIAIAQLAHRQGIPANLGEGEARVAQIVEPRSRREE